MSDPGTRRFEGWAVVVTGAANGIGRATATAFAADGANLVLTDIDEDGLERMRAQLSSSGAEVVAVLGDVSIDRDAHRMIEASVEAFGRIDVLVANAGIILTGPLEDTTTEMWDRIMSVDARGMFLTCKYAVQAMRQGSSGSIVCLSSISGLAGQAHQAAYGPAKFVATGLTKHLAVECAADGIRVDAVAPGTIRTEAVEALSEAALRRLREAHPMKRLGEPDEVARAILFLASTEASFITGAVLAIDGGYTAQ